MKLSYQIKKLRKERGLTQAQLAKKVGCSSWTISAWECDLRSPNPTQRKKLCEVFGITESELHGGISLQDKHLNYLFVEISKRDGKSQRVIKCILEKTLRLPLARVEALNLFI